jgi:hypothetical protein
VSVRAIAAGLFLPMLFWTGAVVVVTLLGYPGVVCVTPLAWLLALPVGLRVVHESEGEPGVVQVEGLVAGGLLGIWQAVLFGAATALSPFAVSSAESLPNPWLVGGLGALIGAPVTAAVGLAAAWWGLRRKSKG